ncbi:MAG: PAS domain-containing sensor histidine kinase [Limisphaerales bacterium]
MPTPHKTADCNQPPPNCFQTLIPFVLLSLACLALSSLASLSLQSHPSLHKTLNTLQPWLLLTASSIILAILLKRQARLLERFIDRLNQSQQEAQQQGTLLQAVTEATTDAIFVTDTNGRYLLLNSGAAKLGGSPPNSILGKDVTAVFNPEDAQRIMQHDREIMSSGQVITEDETVMLNGRKTTLHCTKGPIQNHQGDTIGLFGIVRDITDRIQIEEALRSERDFSTSLLNSLPGVLFCYDENKQLLRWNKNLSSATGYSDEEISRLDPVQLFSPKDQQRIRDNIQQVFQSGRGDLEADLVTKNGNTIPHYFTGTLSTLQGRNCLISVGIDISARKAATRDLLRLRHVFLHAGWGMAIADPRTHTLLEANPAFASMHGYEPDEVQGMNLADFFDDSSRSELPHHVAIANSQGYHVYESTHLRKDHSTFPSLTNVTTFKDELGKVLFRAATFEDITHRKKAADELHASEEHLRLALDAAHMGIFDWNITEDKIVWTLWLEELWGYQPGEFNGTYDGVIQRIHPDDLAEFETKVRHSLEQNTLFLHEFRVVWPNQSVHWILSNGLLSRSSLGTKATEHMRGVVLDITPRKHAEEQTVLHQQQLRALSSRLENLREAERTAISREIHDELGQMLTATSMDLSWIEHALDEFGDDRRVNPILDKLAAASDLVDTITSKVQNIAADLRPSILDNFGLGTALQYETSRFQERFGIRCKTSIPQKEPELPAPVATTCFRILQEALTNIARHANASEIEVNLQTTPESITIDIRDNGCGIPDPDLTNPNALGLLGMQERAKSIGGNVSFTTRPDSGTIVHVQIPNQRDKL